VAVEYLADAGFRAGLSTSDAYEEGRPTRTRGPFLIYDPFGSMARGVRVKHPLTLTLIARGADRAKKASARPIGSGPIGPHLEQRSIAFALGR
jgi:hypothetical protein